CNEVASTIDILPTLAGLCNAKLPEKKIDGKDIKALMLGEPGAKSPHQHYALMHGPGTVRSGPWKFYPWKETNSGKYVLKDHVPSKDPVQLYNVVTDIGERSNVASGHPELVQKLQAVFDTHVAEIKANQRPTQLMIRPANPIASADLPNRKAKKPTRSLDWSKVKLGDVYESSRSPKVAKRPITISATVAGDELTGIVVAQGGEVVGYSLYIKDGECVFAVRLSGDAIHRVKTPIANGESTIKARIDAGGTLSLQINDGEVTSGSGGLIGKHPAESLCIGHDDKKLVDTQSPTTPLSGKLIALKLE
ncbi:MAG: hypothetical protein HKN47_07875, partial [Pirellulaceae bacterium]|nr:hypothetical protein [Pirellulaceae bacterium]